MEEKAFDDIQYPFHVETKTSSKLGIKDIAEEM